jgi:hypothetical protein
MTWTAIARRRRFPEGPKPDTVSRLWSAIEGAPLTVAEADSRGLPRALRYDADGYVYVVVLLP